VHSYLLQDGHLVSSVVCKLVLNYISRPRIPFNRASYPIFDDGRENSMLKRVGSAAGMGNEYNFLYTDF